LIATCVGYAAFGLLQGLGYFSAEPPYEHHQFAFSYIIGLLLVMTICAAVVEFIVVRTEHPEASSPPPPRPDLRSHPR
jgi:hypothetical protein